MVSVSRQKVDTAGTLLLLSAADVYDGCTALSRPLRLLADIDQLERLDTVSQMGL